MLKTLLTVAVVAVLASSALAAQVYYDNYTDGVNTSAFMPDGGPFGPDWGLLTDQGGYLGVPVTAMGAATQGVSLASAPVLAQGNVWFVKMSVVSDVVTDQPDFVWGPRNTVAIWDTDPIHGTWTGGPSMLIGSGASTGNAQIIGYSYDGCPDQFRDGDLYPFPGALDGAYGDVSVTTVDQTKVGTSREASYVFKGDSNGNTVVDVAGAAELSSLSTDYNHYVYTTATWNPTLTQVGLQTYSATGNYGSSQMGIGVNTRVTLSHAACVAMGKTDAQGKNIAWGSLTTAQKNKIRMGFTSLEIGQTASSDFNLDYVSNLDDGAILLSNWQLSNKTQQQGDATGNGIVDLDDGAVLLGNWQAVSDTAVGTAFTGPDYPNLAAIQAAAVTANGSILLDMKGLGLYKVFIGDANHVQANGTDFLSFDAGKSNINSMNAGVKENNVNSSIAETFGALDLNNSIASASYDPDFPEDTVSVLKDTFVNVDAAALSAAGKTLWLQTLVTNGQSQYIALTPVPEPATMALLAMGGLSVLARRRK